MYGIKQAHARHDLTRCAPEIPCDKERTLQSKEREKERAFSNDADMVSVAIFVSVDYMQEKRESGIRLASAPPRRE